MIAKQRDEPIAKNAADTLAPSVEMPADAVQSEHERIVGHVSSERDGLRSAARKAADGPVQQELHGRAPQNETGAFRVSGLLVRRLNMDGARWIDLQTVDGAPWDAIAYDAGDETRPLRIQVTRAVADEPYWRTLAMSGTNNVSHVPGRWAEPIRNAVDAKCRKYPRSERERMVLALDAVALGALIIDDVREAVLRSVGAHADTSAFEAVWLVGPTPETCYQITARDH